MPLKPQELRKIFYTTYHLATKFQALKLDGIQRSTSAAAPQNLAIKTV